ncbi:unnamed protein product [Urochloa humidicola]
MEDLKTMVLGAIKDIGTGMNSRGNITLRLHELLEDDPSVNIELDKSILVWHIATNMYLRQQSRYEENGGPDSKRLVEATKVLSNYMMFLVVVKPDMLPGRTRHEVYLNACKKLDSCWGQCSQKLSPSTSRESQPCSDSLADWLANLERNLGPGGIWGPRAMDLYNPFTDIFEDENESTEDVYNAVRLFGRLRYLRRNLALEIFHVWVEMMLYIAEHCSRDSHARQLTNGGEFITVVWLAVQHLNYYNIPRDAIPSNSIPEDAITLTV